MSKNIIQFLTDAGKLKHLPRSGWTIQDRAIAKPESVAGHMYRMALSAMLLNPVNNEYNRDKVLKMCLIHDLPECYVGDITPFDGVPEDKKHRLENEAMESLASLLPEDIGESLKDLYTEYEKRETVESQIVKDLDRFDVMLQAFEYEKSEYETKNHRVRFQEFFDNANGKLINAQVQQWAARVNREREDFWAKVNADNCDMNNVD